MKFLKKTIGGSIGGYMLRFITSAVLVIGAWNPMEFSIYHYVVNANNPMDAWNILLGVIWVIFLMTLSIATFKALGLVGKVIFLIFAGALAYLSLQEGWVSLESPESIQWFVLIALSMLGGFGLSGAIFWRRLTGQVVTDEALDVDGT